MHARKPTRTAIRIAFALLCAAPAIADAGNYALIQRGEYLVKTGDCAGCHTAQKDKPFAGGVAVPTPFGKIYSTNITPDKKTGIGSWTTEDFYRAMHEGIDREGEHLYPAMPYPWYTRMPHDDVDAIKAYLDTIAPVKQENKPPELPWPMSWRGSMAVWNEMYFKPGDFKVNPNKSAQWNRGAYLVEGPGHCAACHTPKNLLGANKGDKSFAGADSGEHWYAPNLTADLRTGLGRWKASDIVEYLKTGSNAFSAASGQMKDVVKNSTQHLTDEDLNAIAVYLMDMPIQESDTSMAAVDSRRMMRGSAIYADNCAACHMQKGEGEKAVFPSLRTNSVVQAANPESLIHVVLKGTRRPATPAKPTAFAMPEFASKLSDDDVADVLTYVRNSWGNRAPAVDTGKVKELRKSLLHGESG